MAGLNDASKTQDSFQSNVSRGLLTKEERKVEALRKASEQAEMELKNAMNAMAAHMEKVQQLEAASKSAQSDYETAKAQEAQ